MKLPKFFIFITILKLKQYLSTNFLMDFHTEYFTITNRSSGVSNNYNLELIPIGNKIFDLKRNEIIYNNNLFYYLSYNDTNWREKIKIYRNNITIYCEDTKTFLEKKDEIIKYIILNSKIKQIIIGCDQFCEKEKEKIKINNTKGADTYFFITKDKDIINSNYYTFTENIFSSSYINVYFAGDVFADKFVLFNLFLIFFFLCFWIYIICKAKKSSKYLFIHGYILGILIFYFIHTLLYTIITFKKKYQIFDEELFSGTFYNIYNFIQFFTKILPGLFASLQINLFEIREYYSIIKRSKGIHILAVNIFFIISLENDNENLSEILNGILYILTMICLFYMFLQYKFCLEEKIIDAMIDDPVNVPALKYKKKLLYFHSASIVLYVILYYIISFIIKYNYQEYRTIKYIIAFINYSDLLLLFFLVGVHFPRKLPLQYVEQEIFEPDLYENNGEVEVNDYFENIYAFDLTEEEKYFENYKKDEMSSIVIIENPYNENKIEVLIEQDEQEEEEEEKEKEEKEKEKEKGKEKIEDLDDKKDIIIETTEEDSIDKENIELNINVNDSRDENENNNKKKDDKNDIDDNHNNEEEHNALVCEDQKEMINKINMDEDILDLHRTKLGYIEISIDDN